MLDWLRRWFWAEPQRPTEVLFVPERPALRPVAKEVTETLDSLKVVFDAVTSGVADPGRDQSYAMVRDSMTSVFGELNQATAVAFLSGMTLTLNQFNESVGTPPFEVTVWASVWADLLRPYIVGDGLRCEG